MAWLIDVRRQWDIHQRNGVKFHVDHIEVLHQPPYSGFTGQADGGYALMGHIQEGAVTDKTISFTILWGGGKVGEYRGFIYGDGYLRGVTHNQFDPSDSAEWWSFQNDFRVRDY